MTDSGNMTWEAIVREVRSGYPAEAELGLVFKDCRVRVLANQREIVQRLAAYFGPFVAPVSVPDIDITVHEAPPPAFSDPFTIKAPDPGKTKIKEEFLDLPGGRIVRKRLTGMVFVFGGGSHLAVGSCLDNLNQVINFINNRYIEWRLCKGGLLFHAAGVLWGGRGLALSGFSGAGKSTLALHLMSRGASFVSNDRLMVETAEGGLFMHGVAKLPRINPGTILANPDLARIMPENEREWFSHLSQDELWEVEQKYDADLVSCFGPDRFLLGSPMNALVVLNWVRNGSTMGVEVVRLDARADLLPAFMKSTGLFFLPEAPCSAPDPGPDAYLSLLSRCPVIEISGGVQFEKAADVLIRFLQTGTI